MPPEGEAACCWPSLSTAQRKRQEAAQLVRGRAHDILRCRERWRPLPRPGNATPSHQAHDDLDQVRRRRGQEVHAPIDIVEKWIISDDEADDLDNEWWEDDLDDEDYEDEQTPPPPAPAAGSSGDAADSRKTPRFSEEGAVGAGRRKESRPRCRRLDVAQGFWRRPVASPDDISAVAAARCQALAAEGPRPQPASLAAATRDAVGWRVLGAYQRSAPRQESSTTKISQTQEIAKTRYFSK